MSDPLGLFFTGGLEMFVIHGRVLPRGCKAPVGYLIQESLRLSRHCANNDANKFWRIHFAGVFEEIFNATCTPQFQQLLCESEVEGAYG